MVLLSATSPDVFETMKKFVTFAMDVFTQMLANPVLLVVICAGLVGVGISVVRKLRGAAK